MFKTIVVPLDRSENAEQALAPAGALAVRDGAVLHVIMVEEAYPFVLQAGPQWAEVFRLREQQYLNERATALQQRGVRTATAVLEGHVVSAISDYLRASAADLVVITTHGRTGVSRLWLGSVADGIVRHAPVPVLMIRLGAHVPPDARFARIVVTVDGSALSEQVIAHAVALGGISEDVHYVLVCVVQPVPALVEPSPLFDVSMPYMFPTPLVPDEKATREAQDQAKTYMSNLAQSLRQRYAGIQVDTDVALATHVAEQLLELAKTHAADAIAIATHGRGVSRMLIGSVADKIIRGSELPVLVYRPAME